MWNNYLTFIFLFVSVLSMWVLAKNKVGPWSTLLCITLILSFISGVANLIGILAILVLYGLVFWYGDEQKTYKNILWLLIFVLGGCLELHIIPGFNNLLILDKVQFTPDALPYTLYLNLDKTAVGLIIIGLTLQRVSTINEWKNVLKQVISRLPVVILIIIALAILFKYVRFEPKLPQKLWIWIISNLFFTCLAEEGFFRGFLQEFLHSCKFRYSEYVAVLIPALIFGLSRYAEGGEYVILASVAGILYGWVYKVTRRIEVSILTHFALNLTHILLFTYPALIN